MTNIQNAVIKARLSIQRALLGAVSPNLRAVVFSINDDSLIIRYYFEGKIGEDEQEAMSFAETEILADYEHEYSVTSQAFLLNPPGPIMDGGIWVYQRREPD